MNEDGCVCLCNRKYSDCECYYVGKNFVVCEIVYLLVYLFSKYWVNFCYELDIVLWGKDD